jgi:8-oxo-dGTP pyrophosphatase MutT (NUDIX family)
MLDKIRQSLSLYQAPPQDLQGRDFQNGDFHGTRAAVLVPVTRARTPEIILTLRAATLSSHAGEVALPGGKHDAEDGTLLGTALRETEEEIGLTSDQVEVVGSLRPFVSKHGLLVTPFIGLVPESADLVPNAAELAAIFRVPIAYLRADPRSSTRVIHRHGQTVQVPTYHYQGHKIWGLTAMILVEFLNVALEAGIE